MCHAKFATKFGIIYAEKFKPGKEKKRRHFWKENETTILSLVDGCIFILAPPVQNQQSKKLTNGRAALNHKQNKGSSHEKSLSPTIHIPHFQFRSYLYLMHVPLPV